MWSQLWINRMFQKSSHVCKVSGNIKRCGKRKYYKDKSPVPAIRAVNLSGAMFVAGAALVPAGAGISRSWKYSQQHKGLTLWNFHRRFVVEFNLNIKRTTSTYPASVPRMQPKHVAKLIFCWYLMTWRRRRARASLPCACSFNGSLTLQNPNEVVYFLDAEIGKVPALPWTISLYR